MVSDPEIPPPASFKIVKTAIKKMEQVIAKRKELVKLVNKTKAQQKELKIVNNFLDEMTAHWFKDVNGKYFDMEEAELELFERIKCLAPDASKEQLKMLVEECLRVNRELISIHLQRYAS